MQCCMVYSSKTELKFLLSVYVCYKEDFANNTSQTSSQQRQSSKVAAENEQKMEVGAPVGFLGPCQ